MSVVVDDVILNRRPEDSLRWDRWNERKMLEKAFFCLHNRNYRYLLLLSRWDSNQNKAMNWKYANMCFNLEIFEPFCKQNVLQGEAEI